MTLTLDIVGNQAAQLSSATRKVFAGAGGSIGRAADNDWVIADPYISSRHARIHYRNGQYLLEDMSSNGVFVNSPSNRLPRGELYPLKAGDRIFIDAYEIRVSLAASAQSGSPLEDLFGSAKSASQGAAQSSDPFAADPFGVAPPPQKSSARSLIPDDFTFGQPVTPAGAPSTDPLDLLGLNVKKPQPARSPKAQDLARGSPLHDHFDPPSNTTPLANPSDAVLDSVIPEGYDPLLDEHAPAMRDAAKASARPKPGARASASPPVAAPRPRAPAPSKPSQPTLPRESIALPNGAFDFAAMMKGAGLEGVEVTPELAENFGRILRIVVAGLMDVLRARGQIKSEFRMRMTTFKTADNNPLKFSANVDDALHNLLVKRNAAYLGPAEAFEDAFQDVRNHQMAMLAGVRMAFDAMLREFEPDHLQEIFDRSARKASLIAAPARMRYWEMYRDKFQEMAKDPETNFRELFGNEFARAYEEQLDKSKSTGQSRRK